MKRAFLIKLILWILGVIGAFLITKILDWTIPRLEIWKSIKGLFLKMTFPDYVLLIFIIALFIWTIFLNIRIKKAPEKVRKEYRAEMEKEKSEMKTEEEEVDLYPEMTFILTSLADQPDRILEQRYLWDKFKKEFPKHGQAEFQIFLNESENYNLIEETECGELGEICWRITRKGLDHLKDMYVV